MRRTSIYSIAIMASMIVSLLAPWHAGAQATMPQVKVSLDSASLLMGKTTPIHIEVTTPGEPGLIVIPADSMCAGVEVAGSSEITKSALSPHGYRLMQDVVIQSFDSGNYVLRPIAYVSGTDTFYSERLILNVVPVAVDTLTTIHPFEVSVDVEKEFFDWVPDIIYDYWWAWLSLLALIVGAFCLWYFYLRKRLRKSRKGAGTAPEPKVAAEPPYDVAMRALRELADEHLCEIGQERQYYTRLTDILRRYIDARFNINAMEMTSLQILRALRHREQGRLSEQYMRRILEIADYVKFAKLRPFSDDNVQAMADAVRFVEDTKPQPVDPAEGKKQKADSQQPKSHQS